MSWYFRKSVRVGAFRVNLSKRGVGVSAGVRGLRIGIDARGRGYVHAGAGGVSVRHTLSSGGSLTGRGQQPVSPVSLPSTHRQTHEGFSEHGSSPTDLAHDAVSQAIERASRIVRFTPFAIAGFLAICILSIILVAWALEHSASSSERILRLALPVVMVSMGATLIGYALRSDSQRRIPIEYSLSSYAKSRWDRFTQAIEEIDRGTLKVIKAGARVTNPKYHSGASTVIDARRLRFLRDVGLHMVDSNIMIPGFCPLPGTTYHFLPDRLVISGSHGCGSVSYSDISFDCGTSRIIEESPPNDGQVVAQTWRYTNKDGGPDRRFASNPQIPIVEYSTVRIGTSSGMDHALLFANRVHASQFVQHLIELRTLCGSLIDPLVPPAPVPNQKMLAHHTPSSEEPRIDVSSASEAPQSEHPVFEVLLDALCCMMFADGKAGTTERSIVIELMERAQAPWASDEVERRMKDFWQRGRQVSYDALLDKTCSRLGGFGSVRQRTALRKMLVAVASADGAVTGSNRVVLDRLCRVLDS